MRQPRNVRLSGRRKRAFVNLRAPLYRKPRYEFKSHTGGGAGGSHIIPGSVEKKVCFYQGTKGELRADAQKNKPVFSGGKERAVKNGMNYTVESAFLYLGSPKRCAFCLSQV